MMVSAGTAPIRVLLVDDAPEVVVLVRTALRVHGGFEVVGATDRGRAALQLAEETRPDVVVLDLGLPDRTGQEVLVGLQRACPQARVVIYSGVEESELAGMADRSAGFVQKGTDLAHLVQTLERVAADPAPRNAFLTLPQQLSSVVDARRLVSEHLAAWDLEGIVDVAHLVVSELAANAVTHAGTRYEVTITCPGDTVRIAVRDFGPGTPSVGPPQLVAEHGRGLLLVAAMSSSWGVEPQEEGKVVWAELRVDDGHPD